MSDLREFRNLVRQGTQAVPAIPDVGWPSVAPSQPSLPEELLARINGQACWAADDNAFWGAKETYTELPAGLYRTMVSQARGLYLQKQIISTDSIIPLPDSASEEVLAEFRQFWTLKDAFKQRGFLHKRGIMLWGPPGSGKTSTIQLMFKAIVEDMGGIVLFIDQPNMAAAGLQMIRGIEPDRPLIGIMEDFDALIRNFGESEFLALLDGEAQVDNVVFVATTNYPERLDARFVDRPSRFDTIKYVGMPNADARGVYLKTKEPSLTGEELSDWVKQTEGFSIAHLREMIVAIRCFGQPIKDVVERLELMQERRPTSDDAPNKKVVGFRR